MKKILAAVLIISAPAFATAQKPQKSHEGRAPLTAEQRAEKQTEHLDRMLQLNPEQREKIQAENLRTAQAMQPHMEAIRNERKAMREISKRRREAYSNILTPDQQERLKAARQERRKARMTEGHRAPNRRPIDRQAAPAPNE